jgi:hypothetical protein
MMLTPFRQARLSAEHQNLPNNYIRTDLRRPLRGIPRLPIFFSGASSTTSFFIERFISASLDRPSCDGPSFALRFPSSCACRFLLHVLLHRESLGFHVIQKLFFVHVHYIVMWLDEWRVRLAVHRELRQPVVVALLQFQPLE